MRAAVAFRFSEGNSSHMIHTEFLTLKLIVADARKALQENKYKPQKKPKTVATPRTTVCPI